MLQVTSATVLTTDEEELTVTLSNMYRAAIIEEAVDTVRRGFDLTDEQQDGLRSVGVDPDALMGEFENEYTVS